MAAQPSPSLSMEDVRKIAVAAKTWIGMQRFIVQQTAALLKQVESALDMLERMVDDWCLSHGVHPLRVSGTGVQPPRT